MSDAGAQPLTNAVRHYPWGSHTVLPRLLGEPVPAVEPWAEIWMGAHPLDPSHLPDGRSLADVVPGLPFMVKLLAAQDPLSIQAHPDLDQARAGFAAEEAGGVPASSPDRSYKDANHKPELFVALDRTETLCGFRPPADIVATADRLGSAAFSELVAPARAATDAGDALRTVVTNLLRLGVAPRTALVEEVAGSCRRLAADPVDAAAGWVARLAERYPGDAGVLAPLLLELVLLVPGEGLFVDAGVLHAYLHGAGVEVQASSDNVLRGGLTGKRVDVDELLRIVRFEVASGHRVAPSPLGPGVDVVRRSGDRLRRLAGAAGRFPGGGAGERPEHRGVRGRCREDRRGRAGAGTLGVRRRVGRGGGRRPRCVLRDVGRVTIVREASRDGWSRRMLSPVQQYR